MLFTKSFHIQRKYLLIRSFIYFQTRRCSPDLSKFIMRQDKSPFCQKNLNTQSIPSHFENRAGQGPISSKESKNSIYSTEKKNSKLSDRQNITYKNFPDRARKSFLRQYFDLRQKCPLPFLIFQYLIE